MQRLCEALPEEMQMEIMLRMPLRALMKCMCVSKKWKSIIRGEHFRDHYFLRSMTRPRVMFVVYPMIYNTHDVLLHSVYQEEEPLLSAGQQNMFFSIEPRYEVSQPIRGLVCLHEETEVVICNPGTKKFMVLPDIQAREKAVVTTFFVYDEVMEAFKVLCMTDLEDDGPLEGAKEHQVLTVSPGELTWRPITCTYPHSPATKGLCQGEILYYGAVSGGKNVVMRFNVRTEKFSRVDLPEGINITARWKLATYKGKIAVVNDPMKDMREDGLFQIWVMDEVAREWWRISIVIPCWREIVGNAIVSYKGTIRTGELVFAPNILVNKPLFVLYYDSLTRTLRRFEVEEVVGCPYGYVQTYLDHFDSLLLT